MIHGILEAGRIVGVECDPRDIAEVLTERSALLLFATETEEEFERRKNEERDRAQVRWI